MPTENEPEKLFELPGHIAENADTTSEVPQAAAEFRTAPKDAEAFGKVPQAAERKESHTLTVRETARMFEAAGRRTPQRRRTKHDWWLCDTMHKATVALHALNTVVNNTCKSRRFAPGCEAEHGRSDPSN